MKIMQYIYINIYRTYTELHKRIWLEKYYFSSHRWHLQQIRFQINMSNPKYLLRYHLSFLLLDNLCLMHNFYFLFFFNLFIFNYFLNPSYVETYFINNTFSINWKEPMQVKSLKKVENFCHFQLLDSPVMWFFVISL